MIERIYPDLGDCVVLHFKSSFFLDMQDRVIYFAYVSPQGSTIYNNSNEKNGIVLLESKIEDVKFRYPDSYFFLVGDLNARIKYFIDYTPNNDLKYIFGYTNDEFDDFDMNRSDSDGVCNLFGISLAELCCTIDMHIINRRLFGDQDCNFTCKAKNGASLLDYDNIASSKLFAKIAKFSIEDPNESVHFPVYCQFTFPHNPTTAYWR